MTTKQDRQSIEFVQAINALNAHSGGDCPEYTFQGILNALGQDPFLGSPMYVFTDSGPKDATTENIEHVKMLAEINEITINFLSTGALNNNIPKAGANEPWQFGNETWGSKRLLYCRR